MKTSHVVIAAFVAAIFSPGFILAAETPPDTRANISIALPSTAGGGAPAGDEVNRVQCNMLLGLGVAKGATEDLRAVTFVIPPGHAGSLDVYYPPIDDYEDVLKVGGDIGSVHLCDTPIGERVLYKMAFKDDGSARALLPKDAGDGFQVLLVDGGGAFHAAIYTGVEDILNFSN